MFVVIVGKTFEEKKVFGPFSLSEAETFMDRMELKYNQNSPAMELVPLEGRSLPFDGTSCVLES